MLVRRLFECLRGTQFQVMNVVRRLRLVLGISLGCWALPCWAAEGTAAAGPAGGTDIRSAFLPPPGLYGAIVGLAATSKQVRDGSGHARDIDIKGVSAAPILLYVPDFKLFGGSVGLLGAVGGGEICGQIAVANPSRCKSGVGDPYVEMSWSRSFGLTRHSHDKNAFPIREGLTIATGLGAVLPFGAYDARLQASNGITIGNNIWAVAPWAAFTYTTPPLIAEGTEFSSKIYVNNYGTNPSNGYKSGTLVDIDFAISEHVGRWQIGAAGFYLRQIADDRRNGVVVPPDGRQAELLSLGGIVNYDIAEAGASIKFKFRSSVFAYNAPMVTTFILGFAKKLY
jgi:hypothetical protein